VLRRVVTVLLTGLQRMMKRVDLLILDEMGYVTFDSQGAELLFQMLFRCWPHAMKHPVPLLHRT